MLAVMLLGPGQMVFRDIPIPEPGPDEIVLRIDTALTCGTDVKAFRRGHPKWPPPIRFGHEYAGTVARRGKQVTTVREGDEVMLAPTGPCGKCFYCAREQENLCFSLMETMVMGGYAEYVSIPARVHQTNLFPKPDTLSFAEASLLEPLSCVVYGLDPIVLRPDDTAVIIGAGAFGLLYLTVLRFMGIERVYVVARNPYRARIALELGATGIIACSAEDAREEVFALTDGRGADLVVECTAQPAVWQESVFWPRPGGQLILFGGCPPGTTIALDTYRIHYEQVRIFSPFHFTPKAVRRAYELLVGAKLPTRPFISGTYPLSGLPAVFDLLQNGQGIKYAIIP